MAPIENDDSPLGSSLSLIPCPQCSSEASFDTTADGVVQDETSISIPLSCQQCGHKWLVNLPKLAAESTSASERQALIKLPAVELPASDATGLLSPPNIQIISPRQGILKDLPLVAIPRSIFWGILALIVLLVGVSGWLFGELRRIEVEDRARAEQQTALAMVRATGTAEQRMTATQQAADRDATATSEARANLAASATVTWAETSMAATATTERNATSTAEMVATTSAQVAATAGWKATGTAEMVATTRARATATAERIGTATAESRAADNVRATATAERRATSTAEAKATPTPSPKPPPVPKLILLIQACDTGVDIARGLGKVNNAWVTLQNVGDGEASDVKVMLSASDETEPRHPDNSFSLEYLPAGYQITNKLTVNTTLGSASTITAVATSRQGISTKATKAGCLAPDKAIIEVLEVAVELGRLIPILPLKRY